MKTVKPVIWGLLRKSGEWSPWAFPSKEVAEHFEAVYEDAVSIPLFEPAQIENLILRLTASTKALEEMAEIGDAEEWGPADIARRNRLVLDSWDLETAEKSDDTQLSELLMAVAMEAHMMGRIYNKGGEKETPAEVCNQLSRMCEQKRQEMHS